MNAAIMIHKKRTKNIFLKIFYYNKKNIQWDNLLKERLCHGTAVWYFPSAADPH